MAAVSYVGWRVEVLNSKGTTWVGSERQNLKGVTFETFPEAFQALITWGSHGEGRICMYRIVDGFPTVHWTGTRQDAINQGEVKMDLISDLPVINVDREGLIEALQPKLDKELDDRASKEAAVKEANQELSDAVAEFTNDELVAIVKNYYTSDVTTIKEAKKSGKWVPKEIQPSQAETDLARAVRVLGLASDKTVELRPGTNLYNLL